MGTRWLRLSNMLVNKDSITRIIDISSIHCQSFIVKFRDGSDYVITQQQVGYQKIAEMYAKGEYLDVD